MEQSDPLPSEPVRPARPARSERPRLPAWRTGHPGLWLAIGLALALKLILELSGVITFNSDEGVMTVMSRHILRGELPIFHYGQSYMGTVENFLMALVFGFFGQSVFTARIGAIVLYSAGVVGTTYLLAWRLSNSRFAATAAALLVALPPVMITLYTSVSLGAWIAILVLNHLVFWLGLEILTGRKSAFGWWLLAGIVSGVGWWELPIIAASMGPIFLLGIIRFRRRLPWGKLAGAAGGFLIGASPWILALITRWQYMWRDMMAVRLSTATSADPLLGHLSGRVLSALFLNLPALFGLRPSWSMEWMLLPVGLLVIAFYLGALVHGVRVARSGSEPDLRRMAAASLVGAWVLILAVFIPSPFAVDPSGRYIMVLYPPAVVLAADWLSRWRSGRPGTPHPAAAWGAPIVLVALLAYNLAGITRSALKAPPGLTTQFTQIAHIPHDHDDDLVAFLDSIGVDRGYSNFWVTFRFAFLTQERIILAPALPFKEDLSYTTRDNKYPPYMEMAHAADEVVYVTSNHPRLDEAMRERLAALGIRYREKSIGPYTVFYDLPRPVTPEELGPFGEVTGFEIYEP
jgi:4-amino-4-deoxy-L-arabinose transferase-like glycosyltransferase